MNGVAPSSATSFTDLANILSVFQTPHCLKTLPAKVFDCDEHPCSGRINDQSPSGTSVGAEFLGRTEADFAKTHRGLINAFSEHLVKDGTLSKDLGRSLKRAEEMRRLADYDGDSIELADAVTMVADAKSFIAAIEKLNA